MSEPANKEIDANHTETRRAFLKRIPKLALAIVAVKHIADASIASAQTTPTTAMPEPMPLPVIMPVTYEETDHPGPEAEMYPKPEEIEEFQKWADERGITLKGTQKTVFFWTAPEYRADDQDVSLDKIKGVANVYKSLSLLPDDVLEVMREKTIYFSTEEGRSTIISEGHPDKSLQAGIFMGADTTYGQAAVHEFAHVFAEHALGTEGEGRFFETEFPKYNTIRETFSLLFPWKSAEGGNVNYGGVNEGPQGFISGYSTINQTENFAETFGYYVEAGNIFRQKMENDTLLTAKYNFLKDNIFSGKEY